jgi:hypothetical protein
MVSGSYFPNWLGSNIKNRINLLKKPKESK